MIVSFGDRETAQVFQDRHARRLPSDVVRTARRKLMMLDAARNLNDLLVPPSNRLEKLRGDRKGQYSIRINDQWRICFYFQNGLAMNVEIVDYHR